MDSVWNSLYNKAAVDNPTLAAIALSPAAIFGDNAAIVLTIVVLSATEKAGAALVSVVAFLTAESSADESAEMDRAPRRPPVYPLTAVVKESMLVEMPARSVITAAASRRTSGLHVATLKARREVKIVVS